MIGLIAFIAVAVLIGAPIGGLILWVVLAFFGLLYHLLTGADTPDFVTDPPIGLLMFLGFFVSIILLVLVLIN